MAVRRAWCMATASRSQGPTWRYRWFLRTASGHGQAGRPQARQRRGLQRARRLRDGPRYVRQLRRSGVARRTCRTSWRSACGASTARASTGTGREREQRGERGRPRRHRPSFRRRGGGHRAKVADASGRQAAERRDEGATLRIGSRSVCSVVRGLLGRQVRRETTPTRRSAKGSRSDSGGRLLVPDRGRGRRRGA